LMQALTELGIAARQGYCSITLGIGKSHFIFKVKMKRDGTTLDRDRSVLCLAAATIKEM